MNGPLDWNDMTSIGNGWEQYEGIDIFKERQLCGRKNAWYRYPRLE